MGTNDERRDGRRHERRDERRRDGRGDPAGRAGGAGGARVRRPLPPGEHFFTPGASGLRKAVEVRSAAPLTYLFTQVPRWVTPAVLVVLLLAGFAVSSWVGAVAVLPVLAFVGWLAYLSWPSLGTGGRIMRVALAAFLITLAADRFGAF